MTATGMPAPPAPFDAPWHGQVFALAVALNEAGYFAWTEWTEVFSAALQAARKSAPLDGSDDYYVCWISALETLLIRKNIAQPDVLADMKSAWTDAFLSTPHGKPVRPRLPENLQ